MRDMRRESSNIPEVRDKISKGWFKKGESASPGTQFKQGSTPWHKGRTGVYTEEQLKRITEANRGKGYRTAGENNWQWKGGVTPDTMKERVKFGMYTRPKILKRDNYTCVECGAYNVPLHVDHIKSWSEHPDKRFDYDNCRTLCVECHYYSSFGRHKPANSTWGLSNAKIHNIEGV